MANPERNQGYLGIDSNVLVAYLVPDHPNHELTKSISSKLHAINPTVLHETYHTCVFKLKRRPEDVAKTLRDYMQYSLCLPIVSKTVELGLILAPKYSLGGRDALILASFSLSRKVKVFVTMDEALLNIKQLRIGKRILKVSTLSSHE